MTARTITTSVRMTTRLAAAGFVEGTTFHGEALDLDPFLAITDFHMSQPTFAPHPHAGFSAVTYMFTDSAGSFRNRDSLGDSSLIGPGDLHWTQAAAGMMHEEIPTEPGVDCHGLQLFVNLRSDHKRTAPQAFHVDSAHVPTVQPAPGVDVRVVVGEAFGAGSTPHGLLTPIVLLDVTLTADASVTLPVARDHRAVLLVGDGSIDIAGTPLTALTVASLDGPADHIDLAAGPDGASFLVLAGAPIGEPIVLGGPFCMNTEEELMDAQQRFRTGAMGSLAPSF
jgi:redox-sensitive bicupin YhaK (pirin superfamily)